ncbi:unnamed protein product [Ixodes hexagonus]
MSKQVKNPSPEKTRRRASESAATTLPVETPTKKDRRAIVELVAGGLSMEKLPGGQLSFEYETSGALYSWILDTAGEFLVTSASANMPLPLHWSLLKDIRRLSLDGALNRHAKRIEAYTLRRLQVDGAVRHCKAWLEGGKIETTGSCNYARVELNLEVEGNGGRLMIEVWYEDLAVHPVKHALSVHGSDEFEALVSAKLDAVAALLQEEPLDQVCKQLCS